MNVEKYVIEFSNEMQLSKHKCKPTTDKVK